MLRTMTIKLSNLLFHSRIGVGEQERLVGNEFRVSVELTYSADLFTMEELNSTISYAEVYSYVKEVMCEEWKLLESAAMKITERLTESWSIINESKIAICKVAPPISGIVGECGIEYFWKKS